MMDVGQNIKVVAKKRRNKSASKLMVIFTTNTAKIPGDAYQSVVDFAVIRN